MLDSTVVQGVIDDVFKIKRDPLRKTRDFLYRVRDGKRRIENVQRRIQLHQNSAVVHGSSSVERIAEMEELNEYLANANRAYADILVDVADMISCLEDVNQQSVLAYRYIDMLPWDEIADKMGMSKAVVQKIHGRALPRLQEIIIGLEEMENKASEPLWE